MPSIPGNTVSNLERFIGEMAGIKRRLNAIEATKSPLGSIVIGAAEFPSYSPTVANTWQYAVDGNGNDAPQTTVTIGQSGKALVIFGAQTTTNAAGQYADLQVTVDGIAEGGSTSAGSGAGTMRTPSTLALVFAGLASGQHTFAVQFQSEGAVGAHFGGISLAVWPL